MSSCEPSMAPSRNPPDRLTAKFFDGVAPTFSLVSPPRNLTFEFLNHSDPDRATVVRRKAREWVNKNKEDEQKRGCQSRRKTRKQNSIQINRVHTAAERAQGSTPRKINELRTFDAFSIIPGVQKDRYHILQYCECCSSSPSLWR